MSSPFNRRTIGILVGVVAASAIATVALSILGLDPDETSAGPDGYSVSSIGHRGLTELLPKVGIPTIVSRSSSADKAKSGLLVILEPTVYDQPSRERFSAMLESAERVLLVLPKWYATAERGERWISGMDLIPVDELSPLLAELDNWDTVAVQRLFAPLVWKHHGDARELPVIREPQVVTGDLEPLVTSASGTEILLGRIPDTDNAIYVLTDPDVLSNAGLAEPANAVFTVELLDELREGGPVVIDETMHGYVRTPSLLRTLITFPLVLATIQVLLAAALAVWAVMVRFGPRRSAPPPFAPGKDFLVRNTAALLAYGGHHAHALARYLALTVAEVRHALHAPALPAGESTAWLERVRLRRGGTTSLVEIEHGVANAKTPEEMLELADRIFRWRMEMTDGSQHRS